MEWRGKKRRTKKDTSRYMWPYWTKLHGTNQNHSTLRLSPPPAVALFFQIWGARGRGPKILFIVGERDERGIATEV